MIYKLWILICVVGTFGFTLFVSRDGLSFMCDKRHHRLIGDRRHGKSSYNEILEVPSGYQSRRLHIEPRLSTSIVIVEGIASTLSIP